MSIRELKEKALKGGEGDQRRFAWELLGAENYVDSLYWYTQAALQGCEMSQFNVGIIYEDGQPGTKKNATKAVKWYKKSAEQGYGNAYFNLADIYDKGRPGVKKNYTKAFYWHTKASTHDSSNQERSQEWLEKEYKANPDKWAEMMLKMTEENKGK